MGEIPHAPLKIDRAVTSSAVSPRFTSGIGEMPVKITFTEKSDTAKIFLDCVIEHRYPSVSAN
jgi:hypothetical protein